MIPRTLLALLAGLVPVVATADPLDVGHELRSIGTRVAARLKPSTGLAPAAGPGCVALDATERAALQRRVVKWIDARYPKERGATTNDSSELVFTAGCRDAASAIVVDASQDRGRGKDRSRDATRRNFVLSVTPSTIDVIAERTSTPSLSWMEWADIGRLALVARVDLDGDGALDTVWADIVHEGGAILSYASLSVRYANGKTAPIATVQELSDAQIVSGQLVIAGADRATHRLFYRCVGKDLRLAACPARAKLQRSADMHDIAGRYSAINAVDVPDRELLVAELATLGVTAPAALVAAAPATTPLQRAQRHVEQLLVRIGARLPDDELFAISHPEATAYFATLAAKLGDRPCAQTALTADDRRTVAAWVHKQDARSSGVTIEAAACGRYAWAAWSPPDGGDRRQVLLALDQAAPARILGFTYEQSEATPALAHAGGFYEHAGVVVAIVLAEGNLWVVANAKVVAQSKGDVAMYRFDPRWYEHSDDLVVDGGTIWHGTPTGREKIDPGLIRDHERRRAALARLLEDPPSAAPSYLAALRELGAERRLIVECKALVP